LKKGDRVSLVGFGSFSTSKRAARTGRNPQTGKMAYCYWDREGAKDDGSSCWTCSANKSEGGRSYEVYLMGEVPGANNTDNTAAWIKCRKCGKPYDGCKCKNPEFEPARVVFEDNWPCTGDRDFNDAVLGYSPGGCRICGQKGCSGKHYKGTVTILK